MHAIKEERSDHVVSAVKAAVDVTMTKLTSQHQSQEHCGILCRFGAEALGPIAKQLVVKNRLTHDGEVVSSATFIQRHFSHSFLVLHFLDGYCVLGAETSREAI